MRVRRGLPLLAVFTFLLALAGPIAGASPATSAPGPASAPRFIVTLHDGVDAASVAGQYHRDHGADVAFVYDHALNGFAAAMSDPAVRAARADGRVERVERDQTVTASDTESPTPSWGLDRIDQADLPLDSSYSYPSAGAGVTAYIIDTGIRISNADFGGRASGGYSSIDDGNGTGDCNGHGTHVAGTVGGTKYGVAKAVTLVAVRVLDCAGRGSWSGVIAGIDWVTGHHAGAAVANMSLGGGASASVDQAVANSITSGVTYAVAAGNDNKNACNYSPARVAAALTVGATTSTDARASYSNTGSCLDLFAPGSSITSDWNTSDTATNTISGTSMATPHVTGAAALYLAGHAGSSPADVASGLLSAATAGKVTNAGAYSPNRLLRVAPADAGTPPPPVEPVATASIGAASCSRTTCSFTGSGAYGTDPASSLGWTFGNGATGAGPSVSTTYTAAGTYTVTLTASFTATTSTATAARSVKCAVSKGRNKKLACTASS